MQSKKRRPSGLRLVGRQLALFREAARMTQRDLAHALNFSEETISSIEQGRRPLKSDVAEKMDRLLQTKGALLVAVENLPDVDKYPVWAAEYMDYEREAIALSSFENQVLPGLLQTEAYARATFVSSVPVLTEEEIDQRTKARIERQYVLHRQVPVSASFIISEAILMDRLGSTDVYREQLIHLRECAELPGVSIQIMPFNRHAHAALDGPFVLLETPEHHHLAYVESQRGSQVISDQDEVSILGRRYAMLRSQALNPEETKGLLDRLLGE